MDKRLGVRKRDLAAIFASAFNYTGVYILAALWKLDFIHYLILVFILSFVFGVFVANLSKAIFGTFISMGLGLFMTIGFLSIPQILFAETETISAIMSFVGRLLFFGLAFLIVGSIVGGLLGEWLSDRDVF